MAFSNTKKMFADAKMRGATNKEAAVAAGLSEKTAAQSGSRLAKDKDVLAYIERVSGRAPGENLAPAAPRSVTVGPVGDQVTVTLEPQPNGGALKRSHKDEAPFVPKDRPTDGGTPDVLALLQDIAFGYVEATNEQIKAASAALPYMYAKKGETGKKDAEKDEANKAVSKFGGLPPPPTALKVVGQR
ncbi:hypothetical protein [Paraburkholderia sp. J8-2]|uniref:hypothetical protein n=1 Tax=Paraburkholderia sp. J8-2 TaxID=2805440 RepID=UPI002AB7C2A2|nr:hypothetical protein [Paraburkholderia sp. J8-2]